MKMIPIFISLLFCNAITFSQVVFDALALDTRYPKALQKINFSYNSAKSLLQNEEGISLIVYEFIGNGVKIIEPLVKKNASIYAGSFKINANATTVAFGISSKNIQDNNNNKGYIVAVYDNNNKPLQGYYNTVGNLYAGWGKYLFGLPEDHEASFNHFDKGLKEFPSLSQTGNYFSYYLEEIMLSKKSGGIDEITEKLHSIERKPILTEVDYNILASAYLKYFKEKTKADSLTNLKKLKYPHGNWVTNDLLDNFYKEGNVTKKVALYDTYISKKGLKNIDAATLILMNTQIATAYNSEKDSEGFAKWIIKLPMPNKAMLYNNISWNMALEGDRLQRAKQMSKMATNWAKLQLLQPTEKKPEDITIQHWQEQRKMQYAMFADTYAYILYKLGEYKQGLPYAKDAANGNKMQNVEYNERYAVLLQKAASASKAKEIIEGVVRQGKATLKTKEALKALYINENKTENGYNAYLSSLEADAKAKKKAAIAKSIFKNPAPIFALKDLDGKWVSLDSVKGKIVVVDFWATWCSPCKASMPGMKKALENLSTNKDVVFLFVDTWENGDNIVAEAKNFMKKNKYPFYVLMDNENKMVGDFGVSGIPAKFIIDKNGNSRFKSVGFDGDTDALADEITTMVEMLEKLTDIN